MDAWTTERTTTGENWRIKLFLFAWRRGGGEREKEDVSTRRTKHGTNARERTRWWTLEKRGKRRREEKIRKKKEWRHVRGDVNDVTEVNERVIKKT